MQYTHIHANKTPIHIKLKMFKSKGDGFSFKGFQRYLSHTLAVTTSVSKVLVIISCFVTSCSIIPPLDILVWATKLSSLTSWPSSVSLNSLCLPGGSNAYTSRLEYQQKKHMRKLNTQSREWLGYVRLLQTEWSWTQYERNELTWDLNKAQSWWREMWLLSPDVGLSFIAIKGVLNVSTRIERIWGTIKLCQVINRGITAIVYVLVLRR